MRIRRRAAVLLGALAATTIAWGTPGGYASDTRAYNLAHGRVVFGDKCMRCHESGRKGAPVVGDVDDWRQRLEQPLDTLIRHAIEGHGDMPARGDQDITDQDVAAAVAFVVDRTRSLLSAEGLGDLPAPAAGPASSAPLPVADQAVMQMFLMLLGKDRWK
ncbi:MAG: c-type cytochrome [Gammaproteobacteria bacterium]|nr:c-type cytochrome [Gammaproteobacteria bacterium]